MANAQTPDGVFDMYVLWYINTFSQNGSSSANIHNLFTYQWQEELIKIAF